MSSSISTSSQGPFCFIRCEQVENAENIFCSICSLEPGAKNLVTGKPQAQSEFFRHYFQNNVTVQFEVEPNPMDPSKMQARNCVVLGHDNTPLDVRAIAQRVLNGQPAPVLPVSISAVPPAPGVGGVLGRERAGLSCIGPVSDRFQISFRPVSDQCQTSALSDLFRSHVTVSFRLHCDRAVMLSGAQSYRIHRVLCRICGVSFRTMHLS